MVFVISVFNHNHKLIQGHSPILDEHGPFIGGLVHGQEHGFYDGSVGGIREYVFGVLPDFSIQVYDNIEARAAPGPF